MASTLHPQARQRLAEAIQDSLGRIRVQHNAFISWPSLEGIQALDRILPARSDVYAELAEYIGEEPVSDFVIGRLSDALIEREFASNTPLQPLTAVSAFSDLSSAAANLVAELESLPWTYRLFTSVPWELGQELISAIQNEELQLSPTLSIVRLGDREPE